MLTAVIALACLGMLLIGLEFIIPGGITGAIGALLLGSALLCTFLVDSLDVTGQVLLASAILVASIVSVFLWLRVFSSDAFTKRFGLAEQAGVTGIAERHQELIGLEGHARTTLRPAGKAIIDGRSYDAIAESGLIEKDAPVRVVRADGMHLVVRKLNTETS